MRHRHEQLAQQFGNQPTQVVEVAEHRRHHDVEHEQAEEARRAVTFARDRNLVREAVVEERAIPRDALQRSIGTARIDEIKEEVERRAEQGEFIAVEQESSTPGRSFTTLAMMKLEQDTMDRMRAGQDQHAELVSENTREAIAHEYEHLNASQRTAVQEILANRGSSNGSRGHSRHWQDNRAHRRSRCSRTRGLPCRGLR